MTGTRALALTLRSMATGFALATAPDAGSGASRNSTRKPADAGVAVWHEPTPTAHVASKATHTVRMRTIRATLGGLRAARGECAQRPITCTISSTLFE